jgi:F-type H+-transporting ATPase subunit b
MGPLTPKWPDLIIAVFSFLVVLWIVGGVLAPRIARTLAEREDALEGGLDRADGTKAESEAVLREIQSVTNEGRREAARIRQEAAEEGAVAMADARAEGQMIRDELVDAGQRGIAADRALAEAALHSELGLIATELAGKILGESVSDFVAQGDTVERFLAEIEQVEA